jgi:hypothetical protein
MLGSFAARRRTKMKTGRMGGSAFCSLTISACGAEPDGELLGNESDALHQHGRSNDGDGDGVCKRRDNCPNHPNADQTDRRTAPTAFLE